MPEHPALGLGDRRPEWHPTEGADLDPLGVNGGGGLSLATMAELQSGEALSEAAQKDLFQHDPEYVKEVVAQRQNAEEQLLKQMEERTAEMRFQNTLRRAGGNEHAARRMIEAEDQQNARHQQQLHVMRGGN